jgi:hypothetical protein
VVKAARERHEKVLSGDEVEVGHGVTTMRVVSPRPIDKWPSRAIKLALCGQELLYS